MYFFILLAVVFSVPAFAQQIKIHLKNISEDRAALFSLLGEKTNLVDSVFVERNDTLIYNGRNLSTGFYQFRINGKSLITFIFSDCFTNKTIEYLTYYRNPQLPKELLEKEF